MKTVLIIDNNAEFYCTHLQPNFVDIQFRAATTSAVAIEHAKDAHVLIGLAPYIPTELIEAMPKLEWVHALTTGVDNLLGMDALPSKVVISNSSGFHGPQMSELAILFMLNLARGFTVMQENQRLSRWHRQPQPILAGKTVCMVGVGLIAEALAHRCKAFDMRVLGVSGSRKTAPDFAEIYPRQQLKEAAGEADFLVVAAPYSSSTHHIIGESVLNAMKPEAFLINISRGGCVNEDALLRHLKSGSIAGAGLDVFETEPLPKNSPFWAAPNVILTPHIGGMSDVYPQQVLPVVIRNLAAYLDGGAGALPNRVER